MVFSGSRRNDKEDFLSRNFLTIFLLILCVALFVRVYDLGLKPMHYDDAVYQIMYLEPLSRFEAPRYAGIEHHGLLPHLLSAPAIWMFGLSIITTRVTMAVFGWLSIALLYFFVKHLGKRTVLFIAAFMALSPVHVYYSRHFLGYPAYIFFTTALILLFLEYYKSRKPVFLYLMAAAVAALLNINEVFITFLCVVAYFWFFTRFVSRDGGKDIRLGLPRKDPFRHLLVSLAFMLLLFAFIHTAFFIRTENLGTLAFNDPGYLWSKFSHSKHAEPPHYFFLLLFPVEIGLILLAVSSLFFRRNASGRRLRSFFLVWAVLNVLGFAALDYKTNWIAMPLLFPVFFLAGYGAEGMWKTRLGKTMVLLALASTAFFCLDQNFVGINTSRNVLGYGESSPETTLLLSDLSQFCTAYSLSCGEQPKVLVEMINLPLLEAGLNQDAYGIPSKCNISYFFIKPIDKADDDWPMDELGNPVKFFRSNFSLFGITLWTFHDNDYYADVNLTRYDAIVDVFNTPDQNVTGLDMRLLMSDYDFRTYRTMFWPIPNIEFYSHAYYRRVAAGDASESDCSHGE